MFILQTEEEVAIEGHPDRYAWIFKSHDAIRKKGVLHLIHWYRTRINDNKATPSKCELPNKVRHFSTSPVSRLHQ
jgi:hypothetical protein